LLQLVLIYLRGSLQLLHDHLRVILLLHHSVAVLRLLVLLVPAPLVHLRLSQTCCFRNAATSLLGPVGILRILLHQILHLVWIFSISFFAIFVTWVLRLLVVVTVLLGGLVMGALRWPHLRHLVAQLLVVFWAKLPDLWTCCCFVVFVIFVTA